MGYDEQGISIEGTVGTLIFRNDTDGYTVLELKTDDKQRVVATVNAPMLNKGERIRLSGQWTMHKNYGEQFKADSCQLLTPQSTDQLERFLASGLVRGVGPALARAIVETFGDEAANVLEHKPSLLRKVPGIGPKTSQTISESYRENIQERGTIISLTGYGISVSQAIRITNEYGDNAVAMVLQNPYRLADEVLGIGFKTADAIAQNIGVELDSPFRINAALKYNLQEAGGEGHTCLPSEELVRLTATDLELDDKLVVNEAAEMVQSGELIVDDGPPEMVYLRSFYFAEAESAQRLAAIVKGFVPPLHEDVDKCIQLTERSSGVTLAERQLEAVMAAANGSAVVVSGGPGTGKTTIVQFIISVFEMSGLRYALCAPTGRAAKRMGETTDREAKTIHRLLEYGAREDGGLSFNRNDDNPLEEMAVIVDEMSMVDIFLFRQLLRALRPGARLIMIGDSNQLPSVGPGNVLHDIIQSGLVQNVELNTVYRQGEGSAISANAHRINEGEMPEQADGEFEMVELYDPDAIWSRLQRLCKDGRVQVISPMKKGGVGVIALNDKLQQLCNPPLPNKGEHYTKAGLLRAGDKVMQIKNNYSIEWSRRHETHVERGTGIFNGEMGYIIEIDNTMKTIGICFDDDRLAIYDFNLAEELERAYAITVHKSQGSEFEYVAIPVLYGPPMLYTRNLLYTAITRAKKRVWLLGRENAVMAMVNNLRIKERYSGLQRALEKLIKS